MVLITFLQVPYAILHRKLLRVTFLLDRVPPGARAALDTLAFGVGAVFFAAIAVVAWAPLAHAVASGEFYGTNAFRIPAWPLRGATFLLWLAACLGVHSPGVARPHGPPRCAGRVVALKGLPWDRTASGGSSGCSRCHPSSASRWPCPSHWPPAWAWPCRWGGLGPMVALLQQTALDGVKEYNFVVLPLFTVMGMLIAHSGAAADLFNVVNRRLRGVPRAAGGGHRRRQCGVRGGHGCGNRLGSGLQPRGLSGDAPRAATRQALPRAASAGSSVLGLLIPPSVFMIVWAILTEQSVGKLFAAGVFPGILLATLYALYCMAAARLQPHLAPELPPDDGAWPRPTPRSAAASSSAGSG
jgi:hypothetical protein